MAPYFLLATRRTYLRSQATVTFPRVSTLTNPCAISIQPDIQRFQAVHLDFGPSTIPSFSGSLPPGEEISQGVQGVVPAFARLVHHVTPDFGDQLSLQRW